MTYEHLPDKDQAEALILDAYLKYAIMFPTQVREHTKSIIGTDCTHCFQVMALVNALIRDTEGV